MERSVDEVRTGRGTREVMLPPLKRHEVQVLRRAGHSRAEVARIADVSIRTVRRVEDEDVIADVDARAETKRRRVGRPSKAEPFRELVVKLLAAEPEILSVEVLRRVRLDGYRGSKSALYELVARLRPPTAKPLVRFEGLAGEFCQHDFGHVDVRFMDGRTRRVHFFASRMKFSRWVEVTIVPNERVEPLVRTLVEHFESMQGVPLLSVFDRPKTIVVKSKHDGTVTEWNPTFAQVMLELAVGVELCWPRSGNQKGSVERLVGWVKTSFFKQRRFFDEEDLERQLREWLDEVNQRTPSRATGVTPAERMAEERARFRPVKVSSRDLALRIPIVVGPTAVVTYEGVPYSMPPAATGFPGTLFLYRDRVRIVAGRYEALHERGRGPGAGSVLPEHRAQMVAAVSGKRAKRYYKREQLHALGATVQAYLTELVHRRPQRWMSDVEQLFALLQKHGDDATRSAIERAHARRLFLAEHVARLLEDHDPRQLVIAMSKRPRKAARRGGRR